ncbi:MAG: DoxX family protein, partial [Flavobacteriales bacterium]
AAFGMAGFMKVSAPMDQLVANGMTFVTSYDSSTVRLIGVSELLAALGLILPAALRIMPILTPLAAAGLSVIMLLAAQYHLSHDEPIVATVVFFVLTVFVALGRYKKAPIKAK